MPVVYLHALTGERREATTLEQYAWFQQNRSMWSQQPIPGTEPPAAEPTKAAKKPKS